MVKIDLTQAELEEEFWLAMIHLERSLIAPTASGGKDEEVNENLFKVFTFRPQFAGLLQRKNSKIFENPIWPLNL